MTVCLLNDEFTLICGPSGVGKDYGLVRPLAEYYPLSAFTSGDWCREHAEEHARGGILVDDDLILKATFSRWEAIKKERHGATFNFALDAVRTLDQGKGFVDWAMKKGAKKVNTLHIHAGPEVCRDRIASRATQQSRLDDAKPSVIRKRLGTYFGVESPDSTDESYSYIGEGGILHEVVPWLKTNTEYHFIDAEMSMEDVRNYTRLCLGPALFNAVACGAC